MSDQPGFRRFQESLLSVLLTAVLGISVPLLIGAGPASATARMALSATDWADSSFCASYGVRYMGTTYNGVAACGNAYPNNYQGKISYNGVEFDSVGFQCVELAARYFYYMSGQVPPLVQNASDYAYYLGADYGYRVYPAGLTGGTSTFQNSLTPGNVISMWSASDQVGHVAVVTSVNVTGGNGTITVMDENASATGADTITVSGGAMSYQGIYPDFQWTTNLPGSGNPAPGGPVDLLRSGSFEGSAAGWQKFVPAGATVNMSDYNTAAGAPAIAHDGTWYLATNTSTGGGGVYQDVPVSAGPGTAYVGTAWLSSQAGTATGVLCLWGLGTSSTSTCERYKVAAGVYKQVQVAYVATQNLTAVRFQLYPDANGGTTDMDTASLS
jgi:surface antigen